MAHPTMDPSPDAGGHDSTPPGGDLLHSVLEHMRKGVMHCKMLYEDARPSDFIFIYTNPGFTRQTRLGQVVGRRATEVLPGIRGSDPALLEVLGRVAAGGAAETFEKYVNVLGEWLSVQVYSPRPEHFVAMFNVVTGRKRAEQRHADLLAEQRAILDSGIVGLVKIGGHKILWANSAFQQLFGYALSELVGQSPLILYPTLKAHERFELATGRALAAGQVCRIEYELCHKDGSLRWFAISTTLLVPGGEEVIGAFNDITESKRLEAALTRSEAQLKEAQRIARIGHWERDLQTDAIEWSDEMYSIYGVPERGPRPKPAEGLVTVHPLDLEPTRQAFQDSVDDETPLDFVHRVLDPGGEIRHVHVRGVTTYAGDGTPLVAAGTAQDVTEATRLQAALRDEEARLRAIFAAMSEGLVIYAGDGRIAEANPAAEHILGLARDQLLGRTSMDPQWRTVQEDGTPFPGQQHPAMVTLRTGQPLRDQSMGVQAPSFGLRWLSVNASPIFGAGGPAPEAAVASFVDVTERRRLATELATSAAELRDLYDHAPCGYHSLDANGTFVRINDTELAWLGRTREEVIGKLGAADVFSPPGRDLFRRNYPKLLAEGRIDGLEFDLPHADGSVRTVSVSATAVKDAEGRFLMSRSVMYDITALKQAAAARVDAARLEAENRQIHEASRLKSLFLANMSQELRTPLNAVIGMAQLLQSGGVPLDSPQSSALLGQIGDSGRHSLALIDEVLELASAEAGRLEFRPQPEGAGAAGR